MTPSIEDLNHPETRVRIETAQAFIKEGIASLPVLIAAFENPDPEIRWRAAAAAGWIGATSAVTALVKLSRDVLYETQFNAMWALGQIGDTSVVPYLLEILHADETESPDIRYNAALALARLGSLEALQAASLDATHVAYRVAHSALGAARYF